MVAATLAAHPDWCLAAAAPANWQGRGRAVLSGGGHCIRADPATDLCHGFFVAAFEKSEGEHEGEVGGHKKKRTWSEDGRSQNGVVSVEGESGGEALCSNEAVVVGEAVSVENGAPKKKKKEKRKRCETVEGDVAGVETLEENGGEKMRAAGDGVESDGIPDEGPKKKKKRKRKQSETVESRETGVSAKGGDNTNPSSHSTSNIQKSNGVPGEGLKKKKKRSGGPESGVLAQLNGKQKNGVRVQLPASEAPACDIPAGAAEKRKKKRRRDKSADDKEDEVGSFPVKRSKTQEASIYGSSAKKCKKGRLSKRRRNMLKRMVPAAIPAA